MTRALMLAAVFCIAVSGQEMGMGAGRADFVNDVLPILQDRCFECHSDAKRKPKGGLRVDSKSWILLGGKGGPAVVPGKPDRSPLYTRVALPEDHDDVMPPSGEALAKEDIGKIRAWIAAGAPFGSWTGKGGEAKPAVKRTESEAERARLRAYRELEQDFPDPPGAALRKAAESGARVTPVIPGGKLLRVEYVQDPVEVNDGALAALSGLRRHVAILSLGRTAVTDGAIGEVAKMDNLVRLDLQRTKITDEGLVALARAKPPRLRRLNLYGTAVTDKGLDALATIPEFAEVFVWDSKVTAAGAERLAKLRRGCRVHWKRELPAPAARPANDRRR